MMVKTILTDLLRNERGATAVEYGLIAALIVLGMMVALQSLAGGAIGMWNYVATTATKTMQKAQDG